MTFRKLTESNNNYEINSKVSFGNGTKAEWSTLDLEKVFVFSWNMTFGATGEHRSYRSGGQVIRDNLQKFCDVFIGKLGELAFFNISKKREKVDKITEIDYDCYGLGKWDSSDFLINDKYHIAIKTTKHFGNLLLLEEKDWIVRDGKAIYLPNQNFESKGIYNFLFFSRVKTDIHDLIKQENFSKDTDINYLKSIFFNQIMNAVSISLEVVGYVSNQDLVKIIEEDYILPQNSLLNKTTQMDASNYYIQSGFFKKLK
ncbi:hypothetical protein [uncultured Acinetobacter sp.]|uniref:hypothetical protein n=1 Tax=uncultured Acinetobacter sp. TaxID=165433 RepID=UPI0025847722|nr:hypothetical protein [uncultured Acinetobacter sp.]